jgi:hypothetical protein
VFKGPLGEEARNDTKMVQQDDKKEEMRNQT